MAKVKAKIQIDPNIILVSDNGKLDAVSQECLLFLMMIKRTKDNTTVLSNETIP